MPELQPELHCKFPFFRIVVLINFNSGCTVAISILAAIDLLYHLLRENRIMLLDKPVDEETIFENEGKKFSIDV